LQNLQSERQTLLKKQQTIEQEKQAALSGLNTIVETKTKAERELTKKADTLLQSLKDVQDQLRPITDSKNELEKATNRFSKLYPDTISDPNTEVLGAKVKGELKKCDDELRELNQLIALSEKERAELKKHNGATAELCALAESCAQRRFSKSMRKSKASSRRR